MENFVFSWFFLFIFLIQGLTLSPSWECNNAIGSLQCLPPVFKQFSCLTSWVAGTIDMRQHTWLIFVFLVEMRFCHVAKTGLELLTSSDSPSSASQSAGITGVSHLFWPDLICKLFKIGSRSPPSWLKTKQSKAKQTKAFTVSCCTIRWSRISHSSSLSLSSRTLT